MIVVNTVDDNYFTLNGVKYAKIYQPLRQGSDSLSLLSIYTAAYQLVTSTPYNEWQINGVVPTTQAKAIESLLDVCYKKISFTGVRVYSAYDDLPAVGEVNISYKVSNDLDASKNGYYHFENSSYVKDAELNQDIINDVNSLKNEVRNFPYAKNANGVSPIGIDILREFIIDAYIEGEFELLKTYAFSVIQKNDSGEWSIKLYSATAAPGDVQAVAQFSTSVNPEAGDAITLHNLDEVNNSGIAGRISVNWSKIPTGSYSSMYDYNGYGLDPRVLVKNNLRLNDIKKELNSKVYQDPTSLLLKNIRVDQYSFIHPRGLGEYVGDSSYTNQGVAVVQYPLGYRTLVRRIKFAIHGDAGFSGAIEVRKSATNENDPSFHDLVESFTYAVGEFNQDENIMSEVVLTNDLILESNEYLFVYAIQTTGQATLKKWTTQDSNPARIPIKFKSLGVWSEGTNSFLSTSLLLFNDVYTLEESRNNASKINNLNNRVSVIENEISPTVRLILPDTIKAVVGYKQQLFYRGIIEDIDIEKYNIKITGDVGGKQYPRYYEFTPSSTGMKTFIFSIYNKEDVLVNTASCSVEIVAAKTTNTSTKKILCVGDSLTAGGVWTGELLRMLTQSDGSPTGLNLPNIEFIGTVDKGNGNKFEGYGGKTWNWYINETVGDVDVEFTVASHDKDGTDLVSIWQDSNGRQWRLETIVSSTVLSFSRIGHTSLPPTDGVLTHVSGAVHTSNVVYNSYSGGAINPFWNNGTNQLDIGNYISVNGFGAVDIVYALLSWNDMSGRRKDASDHANLIADAKAWIDNLHFNFPNCKVRLLGIQLPSYNGGLAANYGDGTSSYGNYYDLVLTVNGLNLAYQELANDPIYSSFVEFLNISTQFDNENNMPESLYPVNSRSTKTEYRGINGVHPTVEGYYQISDVVFRDANKSLN